MSRVEVATEQGIISVSASYKRNQYKEQFYVVFPSQLVKAAESINQKDALKVLVVALAEAPLSGNVLPPYAQISSLTRQSKSQISCGVRCLFRNDLVRKTCSGQWVVNPALVWNGSPVSKGRRMEQYLSLQSWEDVVLKQLNERNESNDDAHTDKLF